MNTYIVYEKYKKNNKEWYFCSLIKENGDHLRSFTSDELPKVIKIIDFKKKYPKIYKKRQTKQKKEMMEEFKREYGF